jgi:squalene-hopene/tetraprenyl-beta-curcumene cyclase
MTVHPNRRSFIAASATVVLAGPAILARAGGRRTAGDAKALLEQTIAYLRSQQDKKSGGWAVAEQGPTFPAITGLVLNGMLGHPGVSETDADVAAGIRFILSKQQPDGGIYDRITPTYNTSICLATLCRVSQPPEVAEARKKALAFLRTLQWGEEAKPVEGTGDPIQVVTKDHPFYGGVGYGRHGRPDLSNTAFFAEALHASGVDPSDAAFQRTMVFLQRTQMLATMKNAAGETVPVNDLAFAKGSRQGGFVYSTSLNKDERGMGETNAGMIEETLDDGTVASRLRCYGSMTYSGFKSYLYAGLKKDDPRVVAARGWIERNYTLDENPGVGTDGLYYYYVVFARAMAAFGSPTVNAALPDGTTAQRRWADDLTAKLASLQQPDGSFKIVDDRWMENNPVLIAAYAANALASVLASA